MDGIFPSLDWHFRWEKLGVGGVVACWIILSAPVPFLFLWTLDFGFWTWIWDLDLWLGFGTGFGLDNNENEITRSNFDDDWLPSRLVSGFTEEVGALKELMLGKKMTPLGGVAWITATCHDIWGLDSVSCFVVTRETPDFRLFWTPTVLPIFCVSYSLI